MLRNDDEFPAMSSSPNPDILDFPSPPGRQHANNDFDDVFGSAPSSPSSPALTSTDEDIFATRLPRNANTEPSDIGRLRSTHSTSGYREGLAAAKNSTIQAGFDEGFSLGATIGSRVGVVLGVLEGIVAALSKESRERARMAELMTAARRELRTENMFGKDYWGNDGIWSYDVPGEEGEGKAVTWKEVVDAHPLVQKWESIMHGEAGRWRVGLEDLESGIDVEMKRTQYKAGENMLMGGDSKKETDW